MRKVTRPWASGPNGRGTQGGGIRRLIGPTLILGGVDEDGRVEEFGEGFPGILA